MSAGALLFRMFVSLLAWSQAATSLDVFGNDQSITTNHSPDGYSPSCGNSSLLSLLTLEEMILRVLCHDPLIRQAWAEAMAQVAQVGVAQAAYLPSLNASTNARLGHTDYSQRGNDSRQGRRRQLDNRLNLSWVLFDFGRREAVTQNAQQLLVAANANQDSRLQEAFIQAAQLYYAALAAQDRHRTAHQVTQLAAENLKDATAKFEAGAAALADRLLAQTAYSHAHLSELREQGAVTEAKGRIAIRMGMPPQTPIELSGALARRPDMAFMEGVDALLEHARSAHPSLIAAQARMNAAKATVSESEAAGRPVLSFVASLSDVRTRQAVGYARDSHTRDNSIGLQFSIPLFERFERAQLVRAAQAKLQAREAELADAWQQVSMNLWASYQSLRVESKALDTTAEWVKQATLALKVVQGRYRSGVGSMVELLDASSAYSIAEQQHISALNRWHLARLHLAASMGRLGLWTL